MARIIILSIILLLIDLVAFQAIRHLMASSGKSIKWILYGLYWLIPVLTMAYLLAVTNGWDEQMPRVLQVILRSMIFIFYFSKLLIATIVLIDDLRRLLFGALNLGFKGLDLSTARSKWMSYGAMILGAIPVLSLTYGMARNPYRYKLHRSRIPVKNLHPDLNGLKIIQISDIHSGSFLLREPVERSIEMINAEKPDIVFFTGDLVNALASEMEPFIDMFRKIQAPLGVYSVLGNHDYGDYHNWQNREQKQQNFDAIKNLHQQLGWNLLLNEHKQVAVGGTSMNVIGVENYSANPRFQKYGDLKKAMDAMPSDTFNVLLSHDPSHWNAQVTSEHPEINLTLSGHTHGFQFGIEIPGYFKWSPVQYVYPQWAGLYEKAGQYLYVNRGLGYLGYPGRVGILPEITLLTLEQS